DRRRAQDVLLDQLADFIGEQGRARSRRLEFSDQLVALDARIDPLPDDVVVAVTEQRDRVLPEIVQHPAGLFQDRAVTVLDFLRQDKGLAFADPLAWAGPVDTLQRP